ncbi:MAG: hypothetical protein M3485_08855 [Pseudomonadota bacterium]|nr:hypothetical protein [Pseudomonadota bacterium]
MALTFGLTGMDPATQAALEAAFSEANARLHGRWQLAPEAEADHVVVDLDSMYGPMSWLRLHAAGKHVIGLSSAQRTQTEFRLARPFDTAQVEQLLQDIARQEGVELAPETGAPAVAATADADAARMPAPVEQATRAAAQTDTAGIAQTRRAVDAGDGDGATGDAVPLPVTASAADPTPAPTPQDLLPEETPGSGEAVVAPAAEPVPAVPAPPPRDPIFADWLVPAALGRRVRYRRAGCPTLLVDPRAQTWHGPSSLKPIAPCFEGKVAAEDFDPVDDTQWAAESAAAGPAQPLSRLHWLGGLLAGGGTLLPGLDPEGRYRLGKWPQTEREYPKHFRIATAMMKGPATVAEIAEASGIPENEVADFINANITTGYAEYVPEPEPVPETPPKPSGLFGRLRNR